MVKIRLARKGNRKRPFYRVVVAEDSKRRDGRFIEIVGTYDPLKKPAAIEIQSEAVLKWLADGAQPTDTVKRILMKCGVWSHWRAVQGGDAKLEDLTGRVTGSVERERTSRPSKKAATRIAEEPTQDDSSNGGAEPEAEGTSTETADESDS